jgi:hypothetical protein
MFDPKKILRQISIPLLQEFFRRRGELQDLPWEELKEKRRVDQICDAWQQLPDDRRRQVQAIFRRLLGAANERGMRAFAEALRFHDPDNAWKLTVRGSRLNKAVWFYLTYPQLYDQATLFAKADARSARRQAVRRNSLPKKSLQVTPEMTAALAKSLTEHFWPNEMRGRHCHVRHYTRPGGNEYFFAYLDDWPDSFLRFGDDGELEERIDELAFSLMYVACPQEGTLELVASGGRDVHYPLQKAFCKSVLGLDVEPCVPLKSAYNLQAILDPDFTYPLEPSDGLACVRLLSIHWVPKSRRPGVFWRQGLEQDYTRQQWVQDIHGHLQVKGYTAADVLVKNAVFEFTPMANGVTPTETFELSVTLPHFSNLKSLPDEQRQIAETCFRRWGFFNE